MENFARCFELLEDPRTGNASLHNLLEILMIALCAVLCGCETAVDMSEFGLAKEQFLRQFLKLEHGIPSHDTFSRIFQLIDPKQFQICFAAFAGRFSEAYEDVIAIDGKALRRSFDSASGQSPLYMVSAWGCEQRLVLAQTDVDAKSNEITAIPKLLELLSLKGNIVTVDALNCQRNIAQQIVDQGGDYVFALKGNQGTLHDDVSLFLNDPEISCVPHTTTDGDHGRIEIRTSMVSTDIDWLQKDHNWPGLQAIGKIIRVRESTAKGITTTSTEVAYYLLSLPLSAKRLGEVARAHWGIENGLHWVLDVVFNEDQSRTRKDHGPKNLAVLRHMALNTVRKEASKGSMRVKLKRAGWNDNFLAALLTQLV
ncbi:MAG: ISAs1 family transposase [Magnetococcus sp. YQC-3]